jgi:hypothetical protein
MPTPIPHPAKPQFPTWLRVIALLWLAAWIPIYWYIWGASSFLFLCDIAVLLTCIGIWTNSPLLISSQAVSSLVVDSFWIIDVAWMLAAHRHVLGGTEYFFDSHYPLWVRSISLFHVILPVALILALRRVGYDPRGFRLQALISAAAIIASRFAGAGRNINFAFTDPFLRRSIGPAPVHVAFIVAVLVGAIYFPTHLLLSRVFRRAHSGENK